MLFLNQAATSNTFYIGMNLISFMAMVPILIALIQERRIKKPETRLLTYLVLSHMIVCLASMHSWMFGGIADAVNIMKYCDITSFTFSMVGFFCFMRYEVFLLQKRTYISNWVNYFIAFLCGSTVIIMMVGIAQPNPWFWGYDSNGVLFGTSFYPLVYVIPVIIMIFGIGLTWSCKEVVSSAEMLSLIGYFLFPIIGGLVDSFTGGSLVYSLSSVMILMLYANIHIDSIRREVTNEKELTNSKAKLMVSQIQPHFMYNSLNSIYYLIGKDPERAQEAIATFSDYLRQNVNSLRNDAPVLFSEEIGHTQAYLSLEKLRFGEVLNVEFDLKAKDFVVPALTVQPLVENAVKHGITQKEDGGTVKISSEESDDTYLVTIEDDGVGFKTGEYRDNSAHTHVGIENVRSRLETMVGAKLYIESSPDKGTVCTIIIPKESQPR